jgi:hypothetical protein
MSEAHRQHLPQLLGINGLCQVRRKPGRVSPCPILWLTVPRKRDQARGCRAVLGPQTPRDFVTVQFRQPNVEEHDFGLLLLRCTQGAGRTIRRGDVVTLKLQHHREGIRSVFVVINHQYSAPWRR